MNHHLTRGERNQNPGNIRHGDDWQGLCTTQTDPAFCQFATPVAGIRALAKTLLAYQDLHHLHTVHDLISRWAPPNENDTHAYIVAVAEQLHVPPAAPVDLHDPAVLQALVLAIIYHENGRCIYPATTLKAGIMAALT